MNKIIKWLESIEWSGWSIEKASEDASDRSYYRITKEDKTYIIMDASLAVESLPSFLDVDVRLNGVGVKVPKIIEQDLNKGYLILEDLGSRHYLDALNKDNYQALYKKAIDEIVKMQQAISVNLPVYNEAFLLFEMELMKTWYLGKNLKLTLSEEQEAVIEKSLDIINNVIMEQPQGVFVHRDFHSKNIMLTADDEIAVLDFQDARNGSIIYDLVSLLKDCYIEFDRAEIEKLALYYRDEVWLEEDDEAFIRWFDFMGLQRHIKILGIFSRLAFRDDKEAYLEHIPLTLKYITETASKYEELNGFVEILKGN